MSPIGRQAGGAKETVSWGLGLCLLVVETSVVESFPVSQFTVLCYLPLGFSHSDISPSSGLETVLQSLEGAIAFSGSTFFSHLNAAFLFLTFPKNNI